MLVSYSWLPQSNSLESWTLRKYLLSDVPKAELVFGARGKPNNEHGFGGTQGQWYVKSLLWGAGWWQATAEFPSSCPRKRAMVRILCTQISCDVVWKQRSNDRPVCPQLCLFCVYIFIIFSYFLNLHSFHMLYPDTPWSLPHTHTRAHISKMHSRYQNSGCQGDKQKPPWACCSANSESGSNHFNPQWQRKSQTFRKDGGLSQCRTLPRYKHVKSVE